MSIKQAIYQAMQIKSMKIEEMKSLLFQFSRGCRAMIGLAIHRPQISSLRPQLGPPRPIFSHSLASIHPCHASN